MTSGGCLNYAKNILKVMLASRPQNNFKNISHCEESSASWDDEAISCKLGKKGSFHKMRLLRGVYPEELEGLAMTSNGGLI